MNYTLDAYVDHRLEEWAKWIHGIASGDIGFQGLSPIMKILKPTVSTASGTMSFAIRHAIENEKAEEVDTMLKEMESQYPEYAEAIKAFWLFRSEGTMAIAEKHNLSHSAFKQRLRNAKLWLSGRFSITLPR